MKKVFRLAGIVVVAVLVTTCVTSRLDTSMVSVAEEGGLTFTKISNEEDEVIGPDVYYTGTNVGGKLFKTIRWYAPPFIGLSPDSQYIAYICNTTGNRNIFLKRTFGGSSVIQRTFKGGVMDMAYSPDAKTICFSDNADGNQNIFTINATEGAAIQQITSTPNMEAGGVYSPDGKVIYFTKEEVATNSSGGQTSRYYVWGYNKETALMTQYCEGFTPCPLPNGQKILVTRNNRETLAGEIWMVDLKTGLETQIISQKTRSFSSPDISPDGKSIVMVSNTPATKTRPMNLDLYTINIDGTNLTQLTFFPGADVSPKWAPNGKELYFISSRGNPKGKFGVWKMNYHRN
jgi:Tol biopolymer transport system component